MVGNKKDSYSIFDIYGNFVEYLIATQSDVQLRFDTNGRWIGLIV